jgi:hypothetical protein
VGKLEKISVFSYEKLKFSYQCPKIVYFISLLFTDNSIRVLSNFGNYYVASTNFSISGSGESIKPYVCVCKITAPKSLLADGLYKFMHKLFK